MVLTWCFFFKGRIGEGDKLMRFFFLRKQKSSFTSIIKSCCFLATKCAGDMVHKKLFHCSDSGQRDVAKSKVIVVHTSVIFVGLLLGEIILYLRLETG